MSSWRRRFIAQTSWPIVSVAFRSEPEPQATLWKWTRREICRKPGEVPICTSVSTAVAHSTGNPLTWMTTSQGTVRKVD